MAPSASSRVVLASVVTAIAVSMAWIFSEISADIPSLEEPVWRYTDQGWVEISELTSPPQHTVPGPLDEVSPLIWASVQLFVVLILLISCLDGAPVSPREKMPSS